MKKTDSDTVKPIVKDKAWFSKNTVGGRRTRNVIAFQHAACTQTPHYTKIEEKVLGSYVFNTESILLRSIKKAIDLGPIPLEKFPIKNTDVQIDAIILWANQLRHAIVPFYKLAHVYNAAQKRSFIEMKQIFLSDLHIICQEHIYKPLQELEIKFKKHNQQIIVSYVDGHSYSLLNILRNRGSSGNRSPSSRTHYWAAWMNTLKEMIENFAIPIGSYRIQKPPAKKLGTRPETRIYYILTEGERASLGCTFTRKNYVQDYYQEFEVIE